MRPKSWYRISFSNGETPFLSIAHAFGNFCRTKQRESKHRIMTVRYTAEFWQQSGLRKVNRLRFFRKHRKEDAAARESLIVRLLLSLPLEERMQAHNTMCETCSNGGACKIYWRILRDRKVVELV